MLFANFSAHSIEVFFFPYLFVNSRKDSLPSQASQVTLAELQIANTWWYKAFSAPLLNGKSLHDMSINCKTEKNVTVITLIRLNNSLGFPKAHQIWKKMHIKQRLEGFFSEIDVLCTAVLLNCLSKTGHIWKPIISEMLECYRSVMSISITFISIFLRESPRSLETSLYLHQWSRAKPAQTEGPPFSTLHVVSLQPNIFKTALHSNFQRSSDLPLRELKRGRV